MTIAIAVVCCFVLVGVVLLLSRRRRAHDPGPVDAERTTRVGVELHGVRRRLDVAWTRTQLRRDADAARREIADLMREMDGERDDRW